MLEIASDLTGRAGFLARRASVSLWTNDVHDVHDVHFELLGAAGPSDLERVANGEITMAIINPSAMLTVACAGVSPFRSPLPLRPIVVIPSLDQLVFAVSGDLGITNIEEIGESKRPLRVSLRAQRTHSVHIVIDHVLQTAGTSIGDIRSWGGQFFYDEGVPTRERRMDGVRSGRHNTVIDEAAEFWVQAALEAKMRILTMSDATASRLATWGYRTTNIPRELCPELDYDVTAVDFSGFAVYVHADLDDDLVTQLCVAIEARKGSIQLLSGESLPWSKCAPILRQHRSEYLFMMRHGRTGKNLVICSE